MGHSYNLQIWQHHSVCKYWSVVDLQTSSGSTNQLQNKLCIIVLFTACMVSLAYVYTGALGTPKWWWPQIAAKCEIAPWRDNDTYVELFRVRALLIALYMACQFRCSMLENVLATYCLINAHNVTARNGATSILARHLENYDLAPMPQFIHMPTLSGQHVSLFTCFLTASLPRIAKVTLIRCISLQPDDCIGARFLTSMYYGRCGTCSIIIIKFQFHIHDWLLSSGL